MARKRRTEISALNVLFCILVIFIHIVSYAITAFPINTVKFNIAAIPWRLSSFVVQGFLMLSGVKLFLNNKDKLTYFEYLKSRFKGIIIPYAVCFAIYYICYVIEFGYKWDIGYIADNFFTGRLACHFYFIIILLQFDLLFPLWKKLVNSCSVIIVMPIALIFSIIMEMYFPQILNIAFPSLSFIYNDRLFTTYLVYWLIGCYIGKHYDLFMQLINKEFRNICALYVVSLAAVTAFTYLSLNGLAAVPYSNLIHDTYIIYTCVFLYALAAKIPDTLYTKVPLIMHIDKASFYIYLYHILVLLFANKIIDVFGIYAQGPAFVIRCAVVYTVTPLLSILYLNFKKRILPKKPHVTPAPPLNPDEYRSGHKTTNTR